MIINQNTVELKGKDVVASYFCNYFSHISNTVELESPESPFYSYKEYPLPSKNFSMFLVPVTFDEFQKVITNLKNGNSLSLDGLSNILKELACAIPVPLLHILNSSISSGIFPEVWKFAQVIPIHKKGDKTDISNYHPIALLSPISKILEIIIQKRIVKYFDKRNLFTKNQFGFRSGYSTEQAIAAKILEINNLLNNDNCVSTLFYDIKKAFDILNHEILMEKINNTGIGGKDLDLRKTYLHGQEIQVEINGHLSSHIVTDGTGSPMNQYWGLYYV